MRVAPSYHVALVLLNVVGIAGQHSGEDVDTDGPVRAQDIAPATRSPSILRREKLERADGNSNVMKVEPSLPARARERHIHDKVAHESIADSESHHRHGKKKAVSWRRAKQGKGLTRHRHDSRHIPDGSLTKDDYGYIPDLGDRRRRTQNRRWDCEFDADWIYAPNIEATYVKYFNKTDPIQVVVEKCKQICEDMVTTCTGLYVYQDQTVPGQGTPECGVFTVDLTAGVKYVKHKTAAGKLCLHVGKNFRCSNDKNMVTTMAGKNDVILVHRTIDEVVYNYELALSWCKRKCISRDVKCKTFWLQEQDTSGSKSWKCGMYANDVETNDRVLSDDATVTQGCICDAY